MALIFIRFYFREFYYIWANKKLHRRLIKRKYSIENSQSQISNKGLHNIILTRKKISKSNAYQWSYIIFFLGNSKRLKKGSKKAKWQRKKAGKLKTDLWNHRKHRYAYEIHAKMWVTPVCRLYNAQPE